MSLTHQEDVSDYVSWSDDSRLVETSGKPNGTTPYAIQSIV